METLQSQADQLTALLNHHSDPTDDELECIGYVRQVESSTVHYIPLKKLGTMSVADYFEQQAAMHEKTLEPPFAAAEFTVKTQDIALFDTQVTPLVMYNAARRAARSIHYSELIKHPLIRNDGMDTIPLPYPGKARKVFYKGKVRIIQDNPVLPHLYGIDVFNKLEVAIEENGINPIIKLTPGKAESLWYDLERIKSEACDVAIAEDEIEETFVADPDLFIDGDVTDLTEQDVFALKLTKITDLLANEGFDDIADSLEGVYRFKDIRNVLKVAQTSARKIADYAQQEQALKFDHSSGIQTDIRLFSSQLKDIKDRKQKAQRFLRAIYNYFNMAEIYAGIAAKEIGALQDLLVVEGNTKVVNVRLDPYWDVEKDRDPGAISGDCTKGQPLPFDQALGFHNVKVYLNETHRGNIYLLQTTDDDDKTVWHLDAAQIPNHAIDFSDFIPKLLEAMTSTAIQEIPEYITINRTPELVSNYRHVAREFLSYARSRLRSPDGTTNPKAKPRSLNVRFPEYSTSDGQYCRPQGASCHQYPIWEKEYDATF